MSESLEDALEAVALEVYDLQQQYDKFLADNKQREASGVAMTLTRQSEVEDMLRRLNEARQRQTPLLLLSILQSSDRLEAATRNLQQSSEAQVKVAESQVKVSESQALAIDSLLKSSHRLERLTAYLIVLTALNVFIVGQSYPPTDPILRTVWLVGSVGAIIGLAVIAFGWSRFAKHF
jgi:hypothetical protein